MFTPQNTHTHTVVLSASEIEQAKAFAKRIEDANAKNRRQNKQGLTAKGNESLALRESGYCGEAALAKALGYAQNTLGDAWRSRPDVGRYDVMTTKRDNGCLIFTPRDHLLMCKVLVIDCSPEFHLCGWFLCSEAHDAKIGIRRKYWTIPRPGGGCFMVPQSDLKPIAELQRDHGL